jgi:hypothetical protein
VIDTHVPAKLAHIRPCTPPELLDRAFWVFGQRPGLFLACALVTTLPGLFCLAAYTESVEASSSPLKMAFYVLLFLLAELADACGTAAAYQTALHPDRPLKLEPLLNATFARLGIYVLTRMMMFFPVVWFGLFIPTRLLISETAGTQNTALMLLAAAGVLLALRLFTQWVLVSAVVLVERIGHFKALQRSSALMGWRYESPFWGDGPAARLMLLCLPPLLASLGLAGLCILIYYQVAGAGAVNTWARNGLGLFFLFSATTGLASALWWPGLAVLYIENLIRREAFDIQVMLLERQSED